MLDLDHFKYMFKDTKLLETALLPRLYVNANMRPGLHSYERFEFLGDKLLNLLSAERAFIRYRSLERGEFGSIYVFLQKNSTLTYFAAMIGLDEFASKFTGLPKLVDKELADLVEALCYALFLDGGIQVVLQFLLPFLDTCIDQQALKLGVMSNMQGLEKLAKEKDLGVPEYYIVESETTEKNGGNSNILYSNILSNSIYLENREEEVVEIKIGGETIAMGRAFDLRLAREDAAGSALDLLSFR